MAFEVVNDENEKRKRAARTVRLYRRRTAGVGRQRRCGDGYPAGANRARSGASGQPFATLATLGRLGILSYEEQVRAAETSLEASFVPRVTDVAAAVREPARRKEVEREEA